MELRELIGRDGEAAAAAIRLVEKSLNEKNGVRNTLDQLSVTEKRDAVQGLCAILSIRALWRWHMYDDTPTPMQVLVQLITEWIEWHVKNEKTGLQPNYQALRLLEASMEDGEEFHSLLAEFIAEHEDEGSFRCIRTRTTDQMIIELVNYFRYYCWFGYGQSGPENCRDCLDFVKESVLFLLDTDGADFSVYEVDKRLAIRLG